jgi:transposase
VKLAAFALLSQTKERRMKPTEFANAASGFALLTKKLNALSSLPNQILIGLEATSRYGENLYHFLASQGYQLCLLHPRQTHQFSQQRGLRAKTDK